MSSVFEVKPVQVEVHRNQVAIDLDRGNPRLLTKRIVFQVTRNQLLELAEAFVAVAAQLKEQDTVVFRNGAAPRAED